MIAAASCLDGLKSRGYSFFTGVPCPFLQPIINAVVNDPALVYVGASNEGEALGLAVGAYLAGRKAAVLCQNSGLGNMVGPLASLCHPFQVPILILCSWRGEPGIKDDLQHALMGQITHAILDTMRIPWAMFPKDAGDIPMVLERVQTCIAKSRLPFALIMARDTVEECSQLPQPAAPRVQADVRSCSSLAPSRRMTRTEALKVVLSALPGGEAILATAGNTGLELAAVSDCPEHLHLTGGIGTAAAVGTGIALSLPRQPVVVLDGDGSALMQMGSLATVGSYAPENLLHLIIDNESYESMGGQCTVSRTVRFEQVAAACNYRNAWAVEEAAEVAAAVKELRRRPGPSLVHIRIRPGAPDNLASQPLDPSEAKRRFMQFLARDPDAGQIS